MVVDDVLDVVELLAIVVVPTIADMVPAGDESVEGDETVSMRVGWGRCREKGQGKHLRS